MKITHIIIGLGIGGAELMLKRLVESLNGKNEMQHTVISLTNIGSIGSQLQEIGIDVKTLGMKNILSAPIIFFKLRSELKKQMPDVVHTWMYHADFLGGLASKSLGIKNIIWGIRTTDITLGRSKFTIILRKLCAKLSYYIPKLIICAAEAAYKTHQRVGYDRSKMKVIPNGFDLTKLTATQKQRITLRTEWGFSNEHIVIASIGRFNPIKNQKDFIDTAALISRKHPNARFIMIGRDNTWKNQELVSWIKKYNLEKNFVLLGERIDIPSCLTSIDIFCLHSKTEGFPNILAEALILRVPSVSYCVGDAINILDKKFITSSNTPNKLYEKINSILIDYKKNKQFFDLAGPKIAEKYSHKRIFGIYHKVYLDIITS